MIITAFGTVETAVEAMKLGAFDFLIKPFAPEVVRLKIERALELNAARKERGRLAAENAYLRDAESARFSELVGATEVMRKVFAVVERVAPTDTCVAISGESGTGKELVARAVHQRSKRAQGPFIQVNCASLAETLLESELFGHEKGAFTGAIKRKLGRFELADGGTLFLDEIGDISGALQTKLLRVLQEHEFERVGGESTVKVDVRVISATNKDLSKEVAEGRFREDLFYRLQVVPIGMPPLRERKEDIALLVDHFIKKLGPKTNPKVRSVTDAALARLLAHRWPGNVRELGNVIEQAMVFSDGAEIRADALPEALNPVARPAGSTELPVPTGELPLPELLDGLEKQLILKAYAKSKGVKTETARLLGIKTSALYYKLEKYGIT
jgi:two-component system response regulator HydG